MIGICNEYGIHYGITFNVRKSKWFYASVHESGNGILFKLGNTAIYHEQCNISYLGVKFAMERRALVVDISDMIRKFNSSAYNVLLNSSDLSEPIRCELIIKKYLPILTYVLGCRHMSPASVYKLHIAHRKIFRHIFGLFLRSPLTELLNAFGIEPVENVLNRKKLKILYDNKYWCYPELIFVA